MRKIRGSVVGTPIRPAKALLAARDMTKEEKTQARDNINAVGYEVETVYGELTANSTYTEVLGSKTINATDKPGALMTASSSKFNVWYFEASEDFEMYVGDNFSINNFKMAIYRDEIWSVNDSEVYYKSGSTTDDLPRANNKASVKAGNIVAFSTNATAFTVIKETKVRKYSFVLHNEPQKLAEEEKAQARANIGAASAMVETPEEYFNITIDGVISLKPEYRGAIPENSPDSTLDASKSDAGFGAVGSKNAELPKNIIIPAIVNEVAVTGLAVGMIMYNDAVESITIPSYITEIPDYFANAAKGLQAIKGTENVRVLGRSAFFKTPLKTVSFPKLEVAGESGNPLKGSQFKCCSNLISADLGNLTSIPKQMFEFCQRLSCVHGAENVKTVGESAFARTSRLRNVNFLPKLTNISNYAFTSSRIDYDWESLKEAGCTFGTKYATRLQYNPKDADGLGWWEKATPTPCKNPLRSILDQADPLWADEKFKGTNTTFKNMCGLFCAMMIHSALAEKDINHPDDFIKDIENIKNPKHDYFAPVGGKPCVGLSESGLEDLLVDLGHEVTRLKINVSDADPEDTIKHDNLQAVYDALAQGALVWAVVDGASSEVSTDHVNVWYGVNEYGEMLSQDPNDGRVMYFGGENDMHFAIPIQNVHEVGKALMIVKKKAK